MASLERLKISQQGLCRCLKQLLSKSLDFLPPPQPRSHCSYVHTHLISFFLQTSCSQWQSPYSHKKQLVNHHTLSIPSLHSSRTFPGSLSLKASSHPEPSAMSWTDHEYSSPWGFTTLFPSPISSSRLLLPSREYIKHCSNQAVLACLHSQVGKTTFL